MSAYPLTLLRSGATELWRDNSNDGGGSGGEQ